MLNETITFIFHMVLCYKQHMTNLKLLREKNLGLTATGSLTEEVQ